VTPARLVIPMARNVAQGSGNQGRIAILEGCFEDGDGLRAVNVLGWVPEGCFKSHIDPPLSRWQNYLETGITDSVSPPAPWLVPRAKLHPVRPTPHPYFGRKILVFRSLRVGLRCKIVKTKKLPAKSSRIRSYETFLLVLAASGWKAAGRLLESLCDKVGK
jgi:hypothetical protein